jgi:hypothetical protein
MPGPGDFSREAAFADIGAAGVSPALFDRLRGALGASVTPASLPATTASGGIGGSIARFFKASMLFGQMEEDLTKVGLNLDGAELLDMTRHAQHDRLSMFGAWTNSATEIYVNVDVVDPLEDRMKREGASDPRRAAEVVLGTMVVHHELQHVAQFKLQGRPKTYEAMCLFEKEAYAKDAEWLKTNRAALKDLGLTDKIINGLIRQQTAESRQFAKDAAELAKLNTTESMSLMILRNHLPPHNDLAELYKA